MMKRDKIFIGGIRWTAILFVAGLLGGASAYSQPQPIGLWEFNDSNNPAKATIGEELESFGEIFSIGGVSGNDKAVTVPTGSFYRCWHGVLANGGGEYVNQFSFVFDFRVPELGKWYAFYQTNADNANDADAFVNESGNIGVGATGYSSFAIQPQKWYRLIIAVDLAAGTIDYYLDGILIRASSGQSVDGRFALYTDAHDTPYCYFLADDNGEDGEMDISTIMMFDRGLTANEAAALKGPLGAEIAPIDPSIPVKPALAVSIGGAFENVVLTGSAFSIASSNVTHSLSTWQASADSNFTALAAAIDSGANLVSIPLENGRFAFGKTYYARVQYAGSNGKNSEFSDPVSFTLPPILGLKKLYLEDYESTAAGQLPSGWKAVSFSDAGGVEGYESWSVQPLDVLNALEYYPDYEANPPTVFDSQTPVAEGKSCHADSAAYGNPYFEAHLLSPVYNLSQVSNVYLIFNSDYFQNQDNIATVEYTIDGGDLSDGGSVTGTWLPLAYYLESADVTFDAQEKVDAAATFRPENIADGTQYAYVDYVFAALKTPLADLAPFIYPQVEENRMENKRFIRYRVPEADRQASVRFRWCYMGTWSWYWGIDNVQIWGDDGTKVDEWSIY
ncbi:MAG: hypothetical protein AB1656_13450 [Candidatus Omnitrophota bacterium]